MSSPFPAKMPLEKPQDRPLSAAMARMYDVWNPHEDAGNEFYSNFKYSRLEGFSREQNVSRRDPSKVLKIDGQYYVWYTCRRPMVRPWDARRRPTRFRPWTGIWARCGMLRARTDSTGRSRARP